MYWYTDTAYKNTVTGCTFLHILHEVIEQSFNAGIKSLHATLPNEIFYWGFLLLEPCISLTYA
jgi:hypothetical protein